VVVAELALLEVEQEGVRADAAEACQAGLGVAPEALDAVDVIAAREPAAELAAGVVEAQVLLAPHVHQPVVAREAVGVDDRRQVDLASDRQVALMS